jgi:hypothetical protein
MSRQFGLLEFADEVRAVCTKELSPHAAFDTLRPNFERLLGNRTFLTEKLATMEKISSETELYRDPDYDFVILARGVGKHGKRADFGRLIMPHDHGPLWALYGVYEGEQAMQRYEIEPESEEGRFPGLALAEENMARAGGHDEVEPHHIHLPVPVGEGSITIVVYDKPLDSVPRLGYIPELKGVVEFTGKAPPLHARQPQGDGLSQNDTR